MGPITAPPPPPISFLTGSKPNERNAWARMAHIYKEMENFNIQAKW